MNKKDTIKIIESSLLSIASSFPIAASIATGWSEYKNIIQEKNIEDILTNFSNKLKLLEIKIDESYIDTDDFKSLLLKTCFYGKEEIAEDKRQTLGNFLGNSCTIENSTDISKNTILETLIKISEFDIYITKIISKHLNENQKLILSGKKKYDPNKMHWQYIPDILIIKEAKGYRELDVLNTIEYLNSLGIIESHSDRTSGNVYSHIEWYLNNKKFNDLREKEQELISSSYIKKRDKTRPKSEIEKVKEEIVKLENESKNETYKATYEKSYSISSLGLTILKYIE